MKKALIVILSVLCIDQMIKFYIKTHFILTDQKSVIGDWFMLHFTENNGMAFGIEFEGEYGKLFLSIFRIIAVTGIGWYLYDLTKKKVNMGLIISIALIFAGALGNIIDSVFYGMIFSDSNGRIAEFMPPEGGYGTFLHGRVVDMFYFPILEGHFPEWFPFWPGQEFIFFRPVFNFADASITAGVFMIILFQKRFYAHHDVPPAQEASNPVATTPESLNGSAASTPVPDGNNAENSSQQ